MNSLEFAKGETPLALVPELVPESPLKFPRTPSLPQSIEEARVPGNPDLTEKDAYSGFSEIIQQKIGLMNQAGLTEIREVSTVHEKSCSTSKILCSNLQSRVVNSSFMQQSQSNVYSFA